MSRFHESDGCDYDGFTPWGGWRAAAMRGARLGAILRDFLAYLDAMPVKTILLDRFADVASGEFCTLGHLCKSRGMSTDDIAKWDEESRQQRSDTEGPEAYDWRDGASVRAAREVGLAGTIAWELGMHNDMLDHVRVIAQGPSLPHCCRLDRENRERHAEIHRLKVRHGQTLGSQAWPEHRCWQPYQHQDLIVRVPMTGEQRWLRVREEVVRLLGEHERARGYKLRELKQRSLLDNVKADALARG